MKCLYFVVIICALFFAGFKTPGGVSIGNTNGLETVSEIIRSGSYSRAYSEVYIAEDKWRHRYIIVHNYAVVSHGCPINIYFKDSDVSSADELNIDSVTDVLPPMMACPTVMSSVSYYYRIPFNNRYKAVLIHYFEKGHIDHNKAHRIIKLEIPKLTKKR